MSFDIKNIILAGLRDNQFDGNAIRDPWENFSYFYEIRVADGQIKLRLFDFTLIGRA